MLHGRGQCAFCLLCLHRTVSTNERTLHCYSYSYSYSYSNSCHYYYYYLFYYYYCFCCCCCCRSVPEKLAFSLPGLLKMSESSGHAQYSRFINTPAAAHVRNAGRSSANNSSNNSKSDRQQHTTTVGRLAAVAENRPGGGGGGGGGGFDAGSASRGMHQIEGLTVDLFDFQRYTLVEASLSLLSLFLSFFLFFLLSLCLP